MPSYPRNLANKRERNISLGFHAKPGPMSSREAAVREMTSALKIALSSIPCSNILTLTRLTEHELHGGPGSTRRGAHRRDHLHASSSTPRFDGASESATSIAARAGSTNINLNASAGLLRRNLPFKLLQASQQAIEFLRELSKYLVGLIGGGIGPLQVPL